MKTCNICNKRTVMQEFIWENGKFVLKERCCNPYCKTYSPYVIWRGKYK